MSEQRTETCGRRATCPVRWRRSPARLRLDRGVSGAGEGPCLGRPDHRRRSHGHQHCRTRTTDLNLCPSDRTSPVLDLLARPFRDLVG